MDNCRDVAREPPRAAAKATITDERGVAHEFPLLRLGHQSNTLGDEAKPNYQKKVRCSNRSLVKGAQVFSNAD